MDAIVIGAGLAGSAVARSLADRGMRVTVIERLNGPAQETSGNPAGIYMPVLEAASSPREAFYLDALQLLLRTLEQAGASVQHQQTGVVHLPRDEKIQQRFERVRLRDDLPGDTARYVTAEMASQLSGTLIRQDALYYPQGGWLSPASLCRSRLDHPDIQLLTESQVSGLHRSGQYWQALNEQGQVLAEADYAVIASGHLAGQFGQSAWLPLNQVGGQISGLKTSAPHGLKRIICHKGYVLPGNSDELLIGATYKRERDDYTPTETEHEENLNTLRKYLPALGDSLQNAEVVSGRVGFRCVVPGRLPVAGLLAPAQRPLTKGQHVLYDRLAISTAHASRGILSSGLCAELVADQLCGAESGFSQHAPLVTPTRYLKPRT
jgi:tRNA 5-methylaminomethyl-2-thiouridine biosynthesis bifunctional protein